MCVRGEGANGYTASTFPKIVYTLLVDWLEHNVTATAIQVHRAEQPPS